MKHYLILPALLGGFLLTSCAEPGDATEKTTEQLQENKKEMTEAKNDNNEEWRQERTEAVKELRDLRETLANQQAREQERLNEGIKDAEKKAETVSRITELGANIARIDASIVKMEASAGIDWNSLKAESRQTADETRTWWEKQKEAIDKKTDSDKDKDGH